MKSSFTSFVSALVIGLIIGGGVTGLLWHRSLKQPHNEMVTKPIMKPTNAQIREISWRERSAYYSEFKRTARHYFWNLTSITLYRPQYDAMTHLLGLNPNLAGFRLLPGIVGDPTDVIVVNAVDASGANDTTISPVSSPVEPCPPMCDDTTAFH